ncbi:HAD-IIA family hydrolase [Isoptericola sp. NPDC057391]|uniref:HAD-IIA family hydrolase n=1 Tax=Isoptericola sp. NPDC057391 TaxID=3346117 RepID=UPI003625624F
MTGHAVLLDLQGTVYEGDRLVPGVDDAVTALRDDGHAVRFVTNTDSQDSASIVARLRGMGLRLDATELFTPVDAAVADLEGTGARVHVLATAAVRDQLAARLDVVGAEDDPTHVLVGDVHDELDYPALDAAFRAVLGGAELLALQHGRWFLRGGRPALDTGSVVAAIEHGAEVTARTLGKPSTEFLRLALGTVHPEPAPDRTWVVGDDRSSDVAMGLAAGVRTVLVRTGKFARQADDDSLPRAEHVLDDLTAPPGLLGRP